MQNQEINLGDLVQLKSGGPVMTLGDQEGGSLFTCYWFDKEEVFHREMLSIYALKRVEDVKND